VSGIYLGDSGSVEILRTALNTPLSSLLDEADVNVTRKRFSFDFDTTALITGDHIEIRTEDGSDLQLVAGHAFPDWRGYINVDQAGGIRLYASFAEAINGELATALDLIAPTVSQPILVHARDSRYRFLARVSTYQFTTSRESLDLTGLGEEHRRQYASGLISGQGSLTCFWDYERELCDGLGNNQLELSQYLAELVLRAQQGSSFGARLNLLLDGSNSVWWDCPICIVTNVAMAFEPTQVIKTTIEFVTSGLLKLKIGTPPGYSTDFLLQESGDPLEVESA